MNKKFAVIVIGMLFLTTTASIAVSAINIDKMKGNSPPVAPDITVPEKVRRGKLFNVTVASIDPDGDEVYYRHKSVNCTSSWFGPFPSGMNYTFKLSIIGTPGIYTIGVQAKDINDAESNWSYADINVPRSKTITLKFFSFLQMISKSFLVINIKNYIKII